MRDEARLRQAESDLARARRSSGKADRQAAAFLGRISHEVRTPLNAIIGFAEVMIEERFGPIGTSRYKSYLADIRDSGTQVIKLVDDLTDLANAITGRFEIPEDGIDLNQAVVDTVAALQPAAARARIVVRTSFASGLPRLFVDARAIRQVVDNILSNAIGFTEAGGQVIASTALSDRGEIVLRIRDTGIGMSADEIETALEPFRQPSALRTEGRGLGLPLAKALVEANRGSLVITSRSGEGTLVEVLFPAATARSAAAATEEAARRRNA
jgi:signal transduction histidine kinase